MSSPRSSLTIQHEDNSRRDQAAFLSAVVNGSVHDPAYGILFRALGLLNVHSVLSVGDTALSDPGDAYDENNLLALRLALVAECVSQGVVPVTISAPAGRDLLSVDRTRALRGLVKELRSSAVLAAASSERLRVALFTSLTTVAGEEQARAVVAVEAARVAAVAVAAFHAASVEAARIEAERVEAERVDDERIVRTTEVARLAEAERVAARTVEDARTVAPVLDPAVVPPRVVASAVPLSSALADAARVSELVLANDIARARLATERDETEALRRRHEEGEIEAEIRARRDESDERERRSSSYPGGVRPGQGVTFLPSRPRSPSRDGSRTSRLRDRSPGSRSGGHRSRSPRRDPGFSDSRSGGYRSRSPPRGSGGSGGSNRRSRDDWDQCMGFFRLQNNDHECPFNQRPDRALCEGMMDT
jgi:hypothetical protein